MAMSQARTSVEETSVYFGSDAYTTYTTHSYRARHGTVTVQTLRPTTLARGAAPRRLARHPVREELQTAPITRVESAFRMNEEAPRPQVTRLPRNNLTQARADEVFIEATEHAVARGARPGHPLRRWYRELRSQPPRYQDGSYSTEYLPRLMAGYLRYEFGLTLEENMRALRERVRSEYWMELAENLRAESRGKRDEDIVRRALISLDSLPPEDEDADPVPPYEERWEEQYDETFGHARVPAYEA